MATKDFSKLTTKKLDALLKSASDEDKAAIQAELDARANIAEAPKAAPMGQAEGQVYENEEPLSPAEEEALKRADAEYEATQKGEASKKAEKMTDEELVALAAEYKEKYLGHKCQVVPFNTIEWVEGYICGIIPEKRAKKLMFAIRTVDGKKIVKASDSKLLKISDEVADKPKVNRTRTITEKKEEWTPEQIAEGLEALAPNVGKVVTITEGDSVIEGRIMGIVIEKRAQTYMYRIEYAVANEAGEEETKVTHKVFTNDAIKVADELDEKGAAINAKFLARREKAGSKVPQTPEEKVEQLQNMIKEAENMIAKWTDRLEKRKETLAAFLAGQTPEGEMPEAPEAPEAPESETESLE